MRAVAAAPSNIAFVKYWGNLDPALRLPYNASLSMTLSAATTRTEVVFDPALDADEIVIDGRPAAPEAAARASAHLDLIRARAGHGHRARVASANSFPMGTGIASSASAFAALTVAACAATGLALDERSLSALARRGSGSAARSIPDGFVLWHSGADDESSYAESIAPPEHWDLCDVVAIVSREHKAVGSGGGHGAAPSSPFFAARQHRLPERLEAIREALLAKDFERFGAAVEAESYELHAIAMTSRPPLLYWTPATVALLHLVARWRAEGLSAFATLDAGPNVHVLCEARRAQDVVAALESLDSVESVLVNRAAPGARVVEAQS